MPRKGATLAAERAWRQTVLASLARLRPVRDELRTMLAEAESEIGRLEVEARRLEYLDRVRSGTGPEYRVNEYPRSRRKPLLIEDKDHGED